MGSLADFRNFDYLQSKMAFKFFWVLSKNYSMRRLSIRGTYFTAGWAYEETISSLAEPTRKCLKVSSKFLSSRVSESTKQCAPSATRYVHWRTLAAVAERFLEVGCSLISSLSRTHPIQYSLVIPTVHCTVFCYSAGTPPLTLELNSVGVPSLTI